MGAAGRAGQGPGPPQPLPFGFGVFPPARLTGRVPGLNRRAACPAFLWNSLGQRTEGGPGLAHRAGPRAYNTQVHALHLWTVLTTQRRSGHRGSETTRRAESAARDSEVSPTGLRAGGGRAAPWSPCHPRWPAPRDLTTAQHTRALRAGRAWASQSVPKRGSSESMLTRSRAATGGRASYRGTGVPAEQSGLGRRWLLSGRHTCFMACAHTRALCVSACTFAYCARPTQDRVCSQNEQAFTRILFTLVNRGLPLATPLAPASDEIPFQGTNGPPRSL